MNVRGDNFVGTYRYVAHPYARKNFKFNGVG